MTESRVREILAFCSWSWADGMMAQDATWVATMATDGPQGRFARAISADIDCQLFAAWQFRASLAARIEELAATAALS